MKIKKLALEKVAVDAKNYPNKNIFEIALLGRSNVGKSSFINAMTNRKNFARTSSAPGKTRTINFYNIDDIFRIVDLPGYGYAKVSKTQRQKFKNIIINYANYRENLCEILQLVDLRHPPTKDDIEVHNWIMELGFSGIIIATKLDKVKKTQINKNIDIISKSLNTDKNQIIEFSSQTRENVDEMWEILLDIVDFHKSKRREE